MPESARPTSEVEQWQLIAHVHTLEDEDARQSLTVAAQLEALYRLLRACKESK